MPNEKLTHINLGFVRPLTLRELKRAHDVGDIQFHRLSGDDICPDPLTGQNEEWDRVVAAFTEIYYLDQQVLQESQAIFAKYGLSEHGFACTIRFHHVPEWDKSETL